MHLTQRNINCQLKKSPHSENLPEFILNNSYANISCWDQPQRNPKLNLTTIKQTNKLLKNKNKNKNLLLILPPCNQQCEVRDKPELM